MKTFFSEVLINKWFSSDISSSIFDVFTGYFDFSSFISSCNIGEGVSSIERAV